MLEDFLQVGDTFGTAGAVRSRSWLQLGRGRNATCIADAGRAAGRPSSTPVGWHLALHGGWRQVQRAFLSRGNAPMDAYARRGLLRNLLKHGLLPWELGWGEQAERCRWPAGTHSPGLPRGLEQLGLVAPAEDEPVEETPAATPPPQPPVAGPSHAECWAGLALPDLALRVGDWPPEELCCLYGGPPGCFRPELGRTYRSCCASRPGAGCAVFADGKCWRPRTQPLHLTEVAQFAYALEPTGAYSHARLIARVLLAAGVGAGRLAGRPDHGAGGAFRGLAVVEVGVDEGRFAQVFLEAMEEFSVPIREYLLVDRWAAAPSGAVGGSVYGEVEGARLADPAGHPSRLRRAVERLASRWPGTVRFLQADSETAARWLRGDGYEADLVYVDAQHDYDSVWQDLTDWWPVVSRDGIFAGDDYEEQRSDVAGVKRAVDEFAWSLGIFETLVAPIRRCWLLPRPKATPPPERPAWLRLE